MGTNIFYLVTLTLTFDLLLKNFNFGHSFLARRGRAFILHMYIPCDNLFPWVPKFFTLWPWPTFEKNFNLGHSFLTRKRLGFHITYVHSLWQVLFMGTKIFDQVTLTLKFDLLFKNFNLGNSFLTRRGRAFILHMCIPCSKTFNAVPWFFM